MNRFLSTVCAAAAVLGLAGAANAQSRPGPVDRDFMKKAAQGGTAEVRLGRMALRRASSPAVRQFAKRMVDDHSAANQELLDLARSEAVRVTPAPGPEHVAAMNKLSRLSGRAFDRAYMDQMVIDHRKTVALFNNEARNGRDSDVRAFAKNNLPALREHLRMAVDMANGRGGGGMMGH